jgi:SPP1 gp7 family putative phage head morphogenesis protein
MKAWGEKQLKKLGAEASFDMRNPLITEYLDAWKEQKIAGITQTSRDQVTRLLNDAVDEGVGIDEMKRRLREEFEGWTSGKAERIARTEVVGSSNAANLAAYQISGLVDGKEWLAVPGDETRETHRALDGTVVGIKEEFVSESGARTQGPGLFGVAEEDINCRCTVLPTIKDAASPVGEERAAEWKKYDESLRPWEKEITEGCAKAFGQWLGDCIQALG